MGLSQADLFWIMRKLAPHQWSLLRMTTISIKFTRQNTSIS